MTSRTQFIVKHGILRRGTLVGVIVASLFVMASARDGTLETQRWHTTMLAVLCFLEWSVGTGWLIGSFLWSRRHQSEVHGTSRWR